MPCAARMLAPSVCVVLGNSVYEAFLKYTTISSCPARCLPFLLHSVCPLVCVFCLQGAGSLAELCFRCLCCGFWDGQCAPTRMPGRSISYTIFSPPASPFTVCLATFFICPSWLLAVNRVCVGLPPARPVVVDFFALSSFPLNSLCVLMLPTPCHKQVVLQRADRLSITCRCPCAYITWLCSSPPSAPSSWRTIWCSS